MSKKRLRTSSESSCASLKSVWTLERAPKPVIKGSKLTTIDDEKIYLESEPPGKDTKDTMLTTYDLTNLMCPRYVYKIKHYGINFGGGHKYQTANRLGGGGLDTVTLGNDYHTDSHRFVLDPGNAGANARSILNFADTIAWTAGTQGWYESLSLPGSWDSAGFGGESLMHTQPSMLGLINAARYGLTINSNDTLFANAGSSTNKEKDFAICYRGGHQLHTFVNQNEHEIYYECWELTPRDIIYDWMEVQNANGTAYQVYDNIHQYVTYAYTYDSPVNATSSGAASAVNNVGSYLTTSLSQNYNDIGQYICRKNDMGFRINNNCLDLYHKFRVSKPQRGSIKSGGILRYKLKHGPFKVLNSVWNRWVRGTKVLGDADPSNDALADVLHVPQRDGHLIPCATKILCIRFWSELGVKNNAAPTEETTTYKMDFNSVTNVQGRVIHTVDEYHSIRCVPYVKQIQVVEKNFRRIDYNADLTNNNDWRIINDEDNTQMTTQEEVV